MTLRGTLQGHGGWVTQIVTTPQFPDMVLSSSRGILIFNFFFYLLQQIVQKCTGMDCTGNLCIHRAYIMLSWSIRNACDCRRFQ